MKDAVLTPFSAAHASGYQDNALRQVPGLEGLHRMTAMLLAERVPANGSVLVLGAGGGMELKSLADGHPGWRFEGVDPSADMLAVARQTTADQAARIHLVEGRVDAASPGPFDGACSLLTFHFIPREQRLATLQALHGRLRPGAPLVLAHMSIAAAEPERSQWLDRHLAFGGTDPAAAAASRHALATRLTILPPEEEESLLAEAGFTTITPFYAAFVFRGWVAYAG